MHIRAIFFDVDETLVYYDVANLHEKLRELIEGVIKRLNLDMKYSDFEKMVRLEVPRTYVKEFGVDPIKFWRKIDEAIMSFRRDLAKKGLIKAYADTEVLKLIDMPLAAISNASTEATEFVLKLTGLKKYFKVIQGKDYRNIDGCKPSPYLILKVSRMLGVRPEEVMVVGDSMLDILAARRANAIAVHIKRSNKEIPEANITIESLYELLKILEDYSVK